MIKQLTTLKNPNHHRIWSIDWHPKENLLASVGEDRSISLWKQQANQQWIKTQSIVTEHLKTIRAIRFSNKGDKIAVCSFDSLISIYILSESGYEFLAQLQGHENQVKSIDWHESDKKLASCSRDKNIWIWGFNPTTYEYECENILQGHTNDVKYVKWIDYSTLVSCGYDDTIRIWAENDDDYQQFQVINGHQSIVWSVDYKNGYLISTGSDLSVMMFKRNENTLKFQIIKTFKNVHSQPIYGVLLFYPFFVTCSGDDSIKISKINQLQQNSCIQEDIVFHSNDVNSISCKKKEDNSYLMASCSDDGTIKIWNLKFN